MTGSGSRIAASSSFTSRVRQIVAMADLTAEGFRMLVSMAEGTMEPEGSGSIAKPCTPPVREKRTPAIWSAETSKAKGGCGVASTQFMRRLPRPGLAEFCRVAITLVNECHLIDFAQCGDAFANFCEATVPQGNHTFFDGCTFDFGGRAAIDNHFAYAVGEIEQFANSGAPVVASARALEASSTFGERILLPNGGIKTGLAEFGFAVLLGALALRANNADETL